MLCEKHVNNNMLNRDDSVIVNQRLIRADSKVALAEFAQADVRITL